MDQDLLLEYNSSYNALWKDIYNLNYANILLLIILCLLSLTTVLGNLLVLIVIAKNNTLRTTQYLFIFNLATTDFLLGCLVLPFASIQQVIHTWHFGRIWCNLWVSFDVMFCSASVLSLLFITIDRRLVLRYPLQYRQASKKYLIILCFCSIYAVSIGNSFLPIFLGLNTKDGKIQNWNDPTHCSYDSSNTWYAVIVGLVTFIIPLACMSIMYVEILFIAQRHRQDKERRKELQHVKPKKGSLMSKSSSLRGIMARMTANAHNNKATVLVFVVFGSFVLCWLPYMIIYTFGNLWKDYYKLDTLMYDIITWSGYINSTINPLLYTLLNRRLSMAVKKILCCTCAKKNKKLRTINFKVLSPATSNNPQSSVYNPSYV